MLSLLPAMDVFQHLFVLLYHVLHALYAAVLFMQALGRLCTSRLERRGPTAQHSATRARHSAACHNCSLTCLCGVWCGCDGVVSVWLHRCQVALSRCRSPSSRWAAAVAAPPSFSSLSSPHLSSSSLPPFPSFPKRPSHLGLAFRSPSLHFPLIPYLILWSIQAHALSLSLFDLHSSLSLHCPDLLDALLALSHQPHGAALREVEVVVRVKRRLRVAEWRRMEEGPVKARLMRLVGRGHMPTEALVWRMRDGSVQREGPFYTLFQQEEAEKEEEQGSKDHSPWYQAGKELRLHDDDDGLEELKVSAAERRPRRRRPLPSASNGRASSTSIFNGHAHASAAPPFLVNLLSAEHVWDELLNSTIALALPSSSSPVAPFPPPNTAAPPSHLLRSHVLAHAFPLYPLHEVDLLLVFRSPLTLLSFPPWLQRVAEVDHVHEHSAAVWDRRDFEDTLTRYSYTVQKGGA